PPPHFLPPFSFNDPPPTHTYPLSLHDALPIFAEPVTRRPAELVDLLRVDRVAPVVPGPVLHGLDQGLGLAGELEDLAREDDVLEDRKSTRLNSSHLVISYAVFCLKKKINISADKIGGRPAGWHIRNNRDWEARAGLNVSNLTQQKGARI